MARDREKILNSFYFRTIRPDPKTVHEPGSPNALSSYP